MTGLLEKALQRIEGLSPEEQDAIAAQILASLEDDQEWTRQFQARPDLLSALADEALDEHRRGETRPLNELIG